MLISARAVHVAGQPPQFSHAMHRIAQVIDLGVVGMIHDKAGQRCGAVILRPAATGNPVPVPEPALCAKIQRRTH
jgi:hypothetical protein